MTLMNVCQPFEHRLAALKHEASSWEDHWRDVQRMVLPRRGRFADSERNKGDRRNRDIINDEATAALRVGAAGIKTGATNPARPWFRLGLEGKFGDLSSLAKTYLHTTEKIIRAILNRSNCYGELTSLYYEALSFGTAFMFIHEDYESVINCETLTIGTYYIATDSRGQVNTVYRHVDMTVGQVIEKFASANDKGERDYSNISDRVRVLFEKGQLDEWVKVVHAVEPNPDYRPAKRFAQYKKYRSVWFEQGGDKTKLLRKSGYDIFPGVCLRWYLTPGDIYGTSPAMDVLGDTEQLQEEEKYKGKGIKKQVDPPMNAPSSMKNKVHTGVNSISFYNPSEDGPGTIGATPSQNVTPQLGELRLDMAATEARIRRAFHADLWLMLENMAGVQPRNQLELQQRKEEKLLMLGPVFDRLQFDLLDPMLDRIFLIGSEADIMPEPPPELEGKQVAVEYISMLAQAQQASGTGNIERYVGFIGDLSSVYPEARFKLDPFETADEYAEAVGIPPSIAPSTEDARAAHEGVLQAQQQQQSLENSQIAAQNAQILSNTDTGTPSALTDILGGMTGGVN